MNLYYHVLFHDAYYYQMKLKHHLEHFFYRKVYLIILHKKSLKNFFFLFLTLLIEFLECCFREGSFMFGIRKMSFWTLVMNRWIENII